MTPSTQDARATGLVELAERVMPAIRSIEKHCGDYVASIIPASHQGGVIHATEEQWTAGQDAFGARDAFFAAMMPEERDAIEVMNAAYNRLKALGWREAIYCPKDGSRFDAIEPGSTGIHDTVYMGEWPDGSWLVDGDWPSRPCLYRPTAEELAAQAERLARFRALAASTKDMNHDG